VRDNIEVVKTLLEALPYIKRFANEKIEFVWDTIPLAIEGQTGVERLRLRNVKTGEESTLDVEGVFVLVGTRPVTEFLEDALDLDDQGFIKVNRRQETNVPGVFAAGDVTSETPRQIATAVGEGVTAVLNAEEYVEEHIAVAGR